MKHKLNKAFSHKLNVFGKSVPTLAIAMALLVGTGTAAITGYTVIDTSTTQAEVQEPLQISQTQTMTDSLYPGVKYINTENNSEWTVNNTGPVNYTMAVSIAVTESEYEKFLDGSKGNFGIAVRGDEAAFTWYDKKNDHFLPSREYQSVTFNETNDGDNTVAITLKKEISPGQSFKVMPEFVTASDAPSGESFDFEVQIARE